MQVRSFCQINHDRTLMLRDPVNEQFYCTRCEFKATTEAVHQAVPSQYRFLFGPTFGEIIASMLDIGAIDLIFDNNFKPRIEEPRRDQV